MKVALATANQIRKWNRETSAVTAIPWHPAFLRSLHDPWTTPCGMNSYGPDYPRHRFLPGWPNPTSACRACAGKQPRL